MNLYRVRKISTALLLGALVLGLAGWLLAQSSAGFAMALCAIAVGCIAGYWVLLIKFWRCPKCHALLPVEQHFFSVKHCPECGEELDLN